jgi:hypothetical protein
MALWPPAGRIGREVLLRLGVRLYAIGVDKSGLLVREVEKTAPLQAIQNRRKKLLRPFPVSARVGLSVHRSHRASVFGRPASAGFLF